MGFRNLAKKVLSEKMASVAERINGSVPRTLVAEGADPNAAKWRRRLLRTVQELPQGFLSDENVTSYPRIVILGDAGSGKSFVLLRAFHRSVQKFLSEDNTPIPFYLDLYRELGTDRNIEQGLNCRYQGLFGQTKECYGAGCILFLDELDRILAEQQGRRFHVDLRRFLDSSSDFIKSAIISCRASLWTKEDWEGIEPPVLVCSLNYLDEDDYQMILPERTMRSQFVKKVRFLGLQEFLRLPFYGFEMAESFKAGGNLAGTRREILESKVRRALQGTKRDREEGGAPPVGNLEKLTYLLAFLGTFGTTSSWTIQEAIDLLGESESSEKMDLASCGPMLLNRPLFVFQGDKFSFAHNLLQEYLTARAIVPLPIRKKRLLLETACPGYSGRISAPLRGVAIFLAEICPDFRNHLLEADPLVLFLSDSCKKYSQEDEALLQRVLDLAVAEKIAPWWQLPPWGESLDDALPRHAPQDKANFLHPFLESADEFSLLWGTACAAEWGIPELNNILFALAHDSKQSVQIRLNSIDAVSISDQMNDIRKLYDLLGDRDDRIRGHVLGAYRLKEKPSARDFIIRLYGGSNDDHLYGPLQFEAKEFGLSLSEEELQEAFQILDTDLEKLGDLAADVLQGLLDRAKELGFENLPPSLVLKIWSGSVEHMESGSLREIVRGDSTLFKNVFEYLMEREARAGREPMDYRIVDEMRQICEDSVFDLVPSNVEGLSQGQRDFVESLLWHYFQQNPTWERLQEFRNRAPDFTSRFYLPRPPRKKLPVRDHLEEASRIAKAMSQEAPPWQQVLETVQFIQETLSPKTDRLPSMGDVTAFLKTLSPALKNKVLRVFRDSLTEIEYSRTEISPQRFQVTRHELALPFLVLRELGEPISAAKTAEFLKCYGFFYGEGADRDFSLLEELRARDQALWRDTIIWLAESSSSGVSVFDYLIQEKVDTYLPKCRKRLTKGKFDRARLTPLLEYWESQRPPDYYEVLKECYGFLQQLGDQPPNEKNSQSHPEFYPRDRFLPLMMLVTDDDEWAWVELQHLVATGRAPVSELPFFHGRQFRFPDNPGRLPILADWYVHARKAEGKWRDELSGILLSTIIRIGGEDAQREVRRLMGLEDFPDAQWMGHTLLQIEYGILANPPRARDARELLQFLERPTYFVQSERDLFETLCDTVEEMQDSFKKGELVSGLWEESKGKRIGPKVEPSCHNVLWPHLGALLSKRGVKVSVAVVEEKWIGNARVDLWVEIPRPEIKPHKVLLELKIARDTYGKKELLLPLETQLWQKYLQPEGCQHGIYLVLWFSGDSYPFPRCFKNKITLQEALYTFADQVSLQNRVHIKSYVLDVTAETRKH